MEKGHASDSARVLKDLSQTLSGLVKTVSASVLQVTAEEAETRSAIAYDGDHVLTAAVYAAEGEKVTVRSLTSAPGAGGSKTFREVEAAVVGQDPATGLVLLKTAEPLAVPELGRRAPETGVGVGELVVSVALPSYDGVEAKLEMVRCAGGAYSAPGGEVPGYLQTDGPLFPGFAGAPVVDVDGNLVGIRAAGNGPLSFANGGLIIPVSFAFETGKRIAEHRIAVRGYLGVRSQEAELTDAFEKKLGRSQQTGLLVVSVERGSPAEEAGIVTGDILVAIAAKPVASHEDLLKAMDETGTGSPVELEILRGGERTTVSATPTAAPREAGFSAGGWVSGRHHHGPHHAGRRMRRWFQSGTAG